MLTRRAFITAALALGSAPAFGAGYPPVPYRALQDMIDAAAERARRDHGAKRAVVLGVVNPRGNGQLLFAGAHGLTNPAGRPLALDGGTLFEIGSIAKVFTTALHFAQHGPFTGTLGDWLAPRRLSPGMAAIPLAALARYQPGLAQDNHRAVVPPGTMASFDALFRYLARAAPAAPPGTCYSYSNLGWSLLAMAGAGAGHGSAQDFAERYDATLKAYGATCGATHTGIFRPAMKARLPRAYRRNWQVLTPDTDYRPTYPTGVGSGGIVASGVDMLAFLRHQMGFSEGGLDDPALAYLQGPVFAVPACAGGGAPRTAYGWILSDIPDASGPVRVLTKDGAVAGFTAWMGFIAWQGTGAPSPFGVFVLSNAPGAAPLGRAALRRILSA